MPHDPATRAGPRNLIVLAATIFALALGVRLACFTGLIGSDDISYIRYARQISDGSYQLQADHKAARYGVIVPVAAVYRIFGLHEWTTMVLPLVGSAAAAMLTALVAAQLSGLPAGWIAGALMSTFPVEVRYASVLVPEPLLQAVALLGVLVFIRAERTGSAPLGVFVGVCFGIAYLIKESGALLVAAFGAFALFRKEWRLAVSVAAGGALVVAGELLWYWSQQSDLLFRAHALAGHNKVMAYLNENLSYRFWKAYPRRMLIPNVAFGLHSLFALGLAGIAVLRGRFPKPIVMLLVWAVVPFLYLNFGSSSLNSFVALPASPRYMTLVYPPLFVLAAIVLSDWSARRPSQKAVAGSVVAAVCVVGVVCAASTRGTGFRTDHVRRLKEIAAETGRTGVRICEFAGPDATRWQQILEIVAPETLGCDGPRVLGLRPDAAGLPVSE
jgi:4-amino-4-deoxy-L-arabinose transferase-like glycosyltransferase